jgi:hypothetical protein
MRRKRYNLREAEAKWQGVWAEAQLFKTRNDDPRGGALMAQSKAADERVLALLREKPMKAGEIARATRGKLDTMRERMRRLHKHGVVDPAANGLRATEPQRARATGAGAADQV